MSQPSRAEDQPLTGQVAVVTGAGRGIGQAIARAYAGAGATVVCAARTQEEIQATAAGIRAAGGQAHAVPCDVTDLAAVQALMQETVARCRGLDILVINAGGNFDRRPVAESAPADWQATLDVNLTGAYNCAHAAIPHLKARGGGKIITVGSGLGHRGMPGFAAYACAKAGLWMLTRVLGQELWPYNISVNELIPGPVETSLTRRTDPGAAADAGDSRATDESPGDSVFNIQSEWIKEPDDVAPLALFLATQPPVGPSAQSYSLMRRDW